MFCAIKAFRRSVTGRNVYTEIKHTIIVLQIGILHSFCRFGWGRSRLDGEDVGTRRNYFM